MLFWIVKHAAKVLAYLFLLSILLVVLFRFVAPPITALQIIRGMEQKDAQASITHKQQWVPLAEIAAPMKWAVMASEDQKFATHYGFDFEAIADAREHNARSKRKRGGSTLSQQLAKNIFLWPGRSYVRKGLEAYFTLLIELIWSKDRILEVYLNEVEMGRGIYGVEAASQAYFGRSTSKLTRRQAALIAAALPNPRVFNPGRPGDFLNRRSEWIVRQMGYFESGEHLTNK